MRFIWEVGQGAYDMYEALVFCETEEQARQVADAIGEGARVQYQPVPLMNAEDPLPRKVTVWSAWVDQGSATAEPEEVWDFQVRPESARWGAPANSGRAHHMPSRDAAIAAARAAAARSARLDAGTDTTDTERGR